MKTRPKLGPVIAIDGPAGTGKSSATRRLADILGFSYVDTGALYRAIAYLVFPFEEKENKSDFKKRTIKTSSQANLKFQNHPKLNPANRIFANGKDITPFIRTNEISMLASKISAYPEVRASLLGIQRRLGCQGHTILEGRDIGTVIFPDADVKFFLIANVEERAKRRLIELESMGADLFSFEDLIKQIKKRDHDDQSRNTAPLKCAKDAIEIDTSNYTLDQVVLKMKRVILQKLE